MHSSTSTKVTLVTGASSGIGATIAARLVNRGDRVYGTSRSAGADLPEGVTGLVMDVTDEASVDAGVAAIVAAEGRIDGVINNAGVTLLGALEETSAAEALAVLDTNVLGVHRVTRAALPQLRRTRGRCIIVGSIAGFLPKPFEGFYSASKHAVEAYAEVLRFELEPFGVRVTLLEPGYIATPLASHARTTAAQLELYADARAHAEQLLGVEVRGGSAPERVADAVAELLDADAPPLRRLVGGDARRLRLLRSLLPERMFQAGLRRRFGRGR